MVPDEIAFLLVDDDPAFTHVLARALSKRNYTVGVAHNQFDALRTAEQKAFTHAILDLKLGQDSGLALVRELNHRHPQMKIVVLTGYSSITTAVESIKLGASNYLCKPVDVDEILSAFFTESVTQALEIPSMPLSVERLEWEHIQKILQENNGNISATARSLGMHRRTLQRKLQKKPVKR